MKLGDLIVQEGQMKRPFGKVIFDIHINKMETNLARRQIQRTMSSLLVAAANELPVGIAK